MKQSQMREREYHFEDKINFKDVVAIQMHGLAYLEKAGDPVEIDGTPSYRFKYRFFDSETAEEGFGYIYLSELKKLSEELAEICAKHSIPKEKKHPYVIEINASKTFEELRGKIDAHIKEKLGAKESIKNIQALAETFDKVTDSPYLDNNKYELKKSIALSLLDLINTQCNLLKASGNGVVISADDETQ